MKLYKLNRNTLKYEKINIYKICLITISVFILLTYIHLLIIPNKPKDKVFVLNTIIEKYKPKDTIPKLNKKNVLIELKKNNVYFPEIVLKQALLETNDFKSKICDENNNIFGIRHYPNSDTTYAIAKNRGFLCFKNWTDCVKEYKRLQKRNFKDEYYYSFLNNSNYAEKDIYVNILKKMK